MIQGARPAKLSTSAWNAHQPVSLSRINRCASFRCPLSQPPVMLFLCHSPSGRLAWSPSALHLGPAALYADANMKIRDGRKNQVEFTGPSLTCSPIPKSLFFSPLLCYLKPAAKRQGWRRTGSTLSFAPQIDGLQRRSVQNQVQDTSIYQNVARAALLNPKRFHALHNSAIYQPGRCLAQCLYPPPAGDPAAGCPGLEFASHAGCRCKLQLTESLGRFICAQQWSRAAVCQLQ